MRGDVLGKLLDRHHLGILGHGKGLLLLGGNEVEVGLQGRLPFQLCRLHARLGLVDFKQICVDGTHGQRIVNHCDDRYFGWSPASSAQCTISQPLESPTS